MNQKIPEKMNQTNKDEMLAIRAEYEQRYDDLRRRIDSMWWKIGVLSGIVAVLIAEIFGSSASGVINTILGAI